MFANNSAPWALASQQRLSRVRSTQQLTTHMGSCFEVAGMIFLGEKAGHLHKMCSNGNWSFFRSVLVVSLLVVGPRGRGDGFSGGTLLRFGSFGGRMVFVIGSEVVILKILVVHKWSWCMHHARCSNDLTLQKQLQKLLTETIVLAN